MKRNFLKVFVILCACYMCACGNSNDSYMNGHSWGETENQSKSIGWDGGNILGYDVEKLAGASYSNGLSSFRYEMNPGDDSCEKILAKFEKEYGTPDDMEQDTPVITKYTWYNDTVRTELYLGVTSLGISFDVRFVNDEYE